MKIRAIGHWLLLFGSLCLLWSVCSRQLFAGQNYPSRVRVFGNPPAAAAPSQKVDPAEAADIRQLMNLVGTKANVTRMLNSTEQSMKPLLLRTFPPGPYRQRLVDLFFNKFRSQAIPQHLMNLAVPIYAQYLTDADVKGLIQFFQSPLGQKWINVQPKLSAVALPEAHTWGQQLGRETMIEVLREHPHLAQQLRAAEQAAHQR